MSEKVMEGFDEWFEKSIRNMEEAENPLAVEIVRASKAMLAAAWKVSRESLVIELPDCDPHEAVQYGTVIEDCREAIRAAGVRTK